jgi:phosphatidylglycerol:prolipoprotein diacylglycerol transferase
VFSTLANQVFYGTAHALAAVVLCAALLGMLRRTGQPRKHAFLFVFAYLLCNFVAAKLFFDLFKSYEPLNLLGLFELSHYFEGGFWGWLIAFIPVSLLYPFVARLDRQEFFRTLALAMPLVIFFQKLACTVSGCCIGIVCEQPWCFAYPEYWDAETYALPVHPLPVYDAGLMLLVRLLIGRLDRREELRPFLYPTFLGLFGLARFATEMLRPGSFVESGQLIASQLFELAILVAMLGLLAFGRRPWQWLLEPRASGYQIL